MTVFHRVIHERDGNDYAIYSRILPKWAHSNEEFQVINTWFLTVTDIDVYLDEMVAN